MMRSISTMIFHTFSQCMKMKVVAAFIVMLAVCLAILPMIMTGDDTLAGQLRSFLSYSVGVTGIVMSLLTVFTGASLVSSDIRDKQIFSVAVKPLSRSEYIIGRWLGLVIVNLMLLLIAGICIYTTAFIIREKKETRLGPVSMPDRRAVESEVFTARAKVSPEPFDLKTPMEKRIELLRKNNEFETTIQSFQEKFQCGKEEAFQRYQIELSKQLYDYLHTVPVGRGIRWDFKNVNVVGQTISSKATVFKPMMANGVMVVQTESSLINNLLFDRPVRINDVDARVVDFRDDKIAVQFQKNDIKRKGLNTLKKDNPVHLTADPTMQITYKVSPIGSLPADRFKGVWIVENVQSGYRMEIPREAPSKRKSTLSISSRAAGTDGNVRVTLINVTPPAEGKPATVKVLSNDVGILYKVASFEGNFIRCMLLLFCQLIFLSAVSVFAGSFVSFPVACMFCMSLLPFSMARAFLTDAVKKPANPLVDLISTVSYMVLNVMKTLLPDFARTMPGNNLVDGMNVSWQFLGTTGLLDIVIRTGLVLLIACILFHRRELAKVQV